jgi:hypothetical protein
MTAPLHLSLMHLQLAPSKSTTAIIRESAHTSRFPVCWIMELLRFICAFGFWNWLHPRTPSMLIEQASKMWQDKI